MSKKQKKQHTMAEIVVAARKRLEAVQEEKSGEKKRKDADAIITVGLAERKTDTMTVEGLKITRVQNSSMQYDADGLFRALTPSQRAACYEKTYNMGALPKERQAELMKMMRDALTRDELALVSNNSLNTSKLSEAVQAGKIKAATVAEYATEKFSAAYGKVTAAGSD